MFARHFLFAIPSSLPPVIERELRLASRLPGTYWGRVGTGIVGMLIFWPVMNGQLASGPVGVAGLFTFRILACLGAFMMLATIIPAAARAFAWEKREDTLGLLFLTPLKPIDLVLGKLTSSSLGAFYRFVALIPLLAIPMLAGGVTWANFLLLILGLVNLVFFAACVGLCFSASAWDEKRAGHLATMTLLAHATVVPGIAMALLRGPGMNISYAAGLNPIFPVWRASAGGSIDLTEFFWSIALTHGIAWFYFARTCRILPTCWQDKPGRHEKVLLQVQQRREAALLEQLEKTEAPPAPEGQPSPKEVGRARRSVRRQFGAMHRRQLLENNPAIWMAQRWRVDAPAAWLIGCLPLAAPIAILMSGEFKVFLAPAFVLIASCCVNAGFKLYASMQAGLAFSRDRAEDTLELMLSTVLSPRQLVQAHVEAVFAPLRQHLRRVLVIEWAWMIVAVITDLALGNHGTFTYLLLFVVVTGIFIPDLRAIVWAGLWQGVISQSTRIAASNAQFQVLALPWAFALLFTLTTAALPPNGALIVFGLALAFFSGWADWWFTRQARGLLYRDLPLWARPRAARDFEHYDASSRLGRRLGRWWARRKRKGLSPRLQ